MPFGVPVWSTSLLLRSAQRFCNHAGAYVKTSVQLHIRTATIYICARLRTATIYICARQAGPHLELLNAPAQVRSLILRHAFQLHGSERHGRHPARRW